MEGYYFLKYINQNKNNIEQEIGGERFGRLSCGVAFWRTGQEEVEPFEQNAGWFFRHWLWIKIPGKALTLTLASSF